LGKLEYLKNKEKSITNSLNKIPQNTKLPFAEPYSN